jgi:oligopeptide/dipeptide ABC transporter ATP-binding protein
LAKGCDPLLTVAGLRVAFGAGVEASRPVDGVTMDIPRAQTVALVGESGSGKTLTALALMGLLPAGARVRADCLRFEKRDLLAADAAGIRSIRGDEISMVFQEPMTSLNPVLSIGVQVAEPLIRHRGIGRRDAIARATEMLGRVGIPAPARRVHEYPHQLSGGMRQRVMIAMALICQPRLLIADEPTTALDVTIQAQILDLLGRMQDEIGMSILFITHDLSLMACFADHVHVMYAGRIVESAPARTLFRSPAHPYTAALLANIPRLDSARSDRLPVIPGDVPRPGQRPSGCAFHPRCAVARDEPRCRNETPPMNGDVRGVACWSPLGQVSVRSASEGDCAR